MHQDDDRAGALEELLDRLLDMAATDVDTAFDESSSWTPADEPGCDLDSEY